MIIFCPICHSAITYLNARKSITFEPCECMEKIGLTEPIMSDEE